MVNLQAEKLLLSGFIRHPTEFFKFGIHLNKEDFNHRSLEVTFEVIYSLLMNKEVEKLSKSKMVAEAVSLGHGDYMSLMQDGDLIDSMMSEDVSLKDIKRSFLDVKNNSYRKSTISKLKDSIGYLEKTTDNTSKMIGTVESMIISQASILDKGERGVINLTDGIKDSIMNFGNNPGNIGIDLGYEEFQNRVGQIKNGSFTFIAATAKAGKSQLGLNFGIIASRKNNLPVLIIDTEMNEENQQTRTVGQFADIPYNIIETGYWNMTEDELKSEGMDQEDIKKIKTYSVKLKDENMWKALDRMPLDYLKASGMGVQEVIPHIRRWLLTRVKPDKTSKVPQCLILYDYIKLATIDELKGGISEYQLHGLNVGALHDLVNEFKVPCIGFGQTNREITDNFNCVAGAKRIVENVSTICLWSQKTDSQYSRDPNGSHMMKIFDGRFANPTGSYHINWDAKLSSGQFKEIGMSTVNLNSVFKKKKKFDNDDDDD